MGTGKKESAKKKEKRKGERSNGGGGEREVVTDARFASVHSDPRFQNIPRRERKVSIDPRFDKMFTDRDFGSSAAPVDKRGRRKERKENPLQRYYQLEEEEGKEEEEKNEKLKIGGDLKESESEEEEEVGEDGMRSSDESDDMEEYDSQLSDIEVDTDDEMLIGGSDSDTEEQVEEVPEIDQETSRLAAVNLDWHHIKAVDLYALLNSFLPDGGRIRSVSVYPSEFGLQRMAEESVHGPVGLFEDDDKKITVKNKNDEDRSESDSDSQVKDEEDSENEDDSHDGSEDREDNLIGNEGASEDELDDDEEEEEEEEEEDEEEDKDYINDKIRNYEKTRLRYYFAVVCCDSIATANYLYKECDGLEIMQSSNKLDLRYIPDSMEFKQEARDVATEVPSDYKPSDFFTKALQLSKPVLTWDEDEPERAKTLKRKFNADKLDKLELNEFLASDESDSDEDDGADDQSAKKHNKADVYRSLLSGAGEDEDDNNSDGDDGQDMEVTFNTGLEDISKRILERRENKSETVWEAHLRKRKEKRKAKISKKDSDEESDDSDNGEGVDDFFSGGTQLKRHKGDSKSNKKGTDDMEADEEAGVSRAELELLLADDKGMDSHAKGYKIKPEKTKGKKRKEVMDDKLPEADLDDPRFQSLFKNPLFALDPTDPQFKRSAAYRRQLAEKQKNAEQDALPAKDQPKLSKPSQMPSDDIDKNSKLPPPSSNNNNHEISSLVKSIKMKSKEADKRDKSNLSSVAQSLKKKTKHLIK